MDYHEWVLYGMEKGWIGPLVCYTHDGLPMTEDEENEFNEGYDPCITIFRIYESKEHGNMVEYNHTPSQWRKQ